MILFLFITLTLHTSLPHRRWRGEKRSHCIYDALMGYLLMMNRMSLRSLYKCMDGLKVFALLL